MGLIDPTSVLAELGPLDRELVPGWRLEDVRWAERGPMIEVEVRKASEAFIATLDADEHGAARVGFDDRDSTWEGDPKARRELAVQLLGHFEEEYEGRGFADNDGALAAQVKEKVERWRPVDWPTQGEEWQLLGGSRASYRRTFKTEVQVLEHDVGWSLHFPIDQVRPRNTFARWAVPSRFRRREFRAYFADLGFGIDERDEMNIVPVPETFVRRVRERHPGWPWEPCLRGVRALGSNAAWASIWLEDKVPMMVSRAGSFRTGGVYAHDVGFHGCLFHRIDADSWRSITDVLRPAAAEYGTKGREQAGLFIEGGLSRTALEAWNESRHPGEFDEHFQRRLPFALEMAQAHVQVAAGRLTAKDVPTVS